MLLETLQRHDANNIIKVVCVESVYKAGKTLPKVHAVPALMVFPQKTLIFGKEVFDFLLLPGKGVLLMPAKPRASSGGSMQNQSQDNAAEPSAFNMMSRGLSDNFAALEDDPLHDSYNQAGDAHRLYNWTPISEHSDISDATFVTGSAPSQPSASKPPTPDFSMNTESRTKKELPDLSEYKARRDMELTQTDLNISQLPPSLSGRD